MRRLLAVVSILACLCAASARAEPPPVAASDPKPRGGWGAIGVGIGGFVFGLTNLATIPVCYTDWYPTESNVCLGTSVVLGAGGLAVGITGLVLGTRRRAAYKEWRARQRRVALEGLDLGYTRDHAAVQLRLSF